MSLLQNISKSVRPFIIAEVADAHYGSVERAKEMAKAAKEAGADAVKFQHHLPDYEMLPDIPQSSNMLEPLYDFLNRVAFTIEQHADVKKFCDRIGILYLCTPFSIEAARELETVIGPPAYKIGSGEMNDFPTLREISKFGKPLIVSTGMSHESEIIEAYEFLGTLGVPFALLNCTSAYPPAISDIRVGFIQRMHDLFPKAIVGYSDHTDSIYTSLAAIALGAKIIEKHVTISRDLQGPDSNVSITFGQLKELVDAAGLVSQTLGNTRELGPSELEIRAWARRSLVYTVTLPEGSIVRNGDLWGKRPGTGIPSKELESIVGKTLKRSVSANKMVELDDFE